MEDTSLDDFLDEGGSGGGPADGGTGDDETSDSGTEPRADPSETGARAAGHTDGIEPAATTFAFSPEGMICELCGDQVLERWRSGEGLVCAECKAWTAADG